MKRLSIEEKAKRFDEALAMAKECITYIPDGAVNNYMFNMFPELAESDDGKIRKWLINLVKSHIRWLEDRIKEQLSNGQIYGGELSKAQVSLAWLEKQGQTFTKKDVDDAYLKGVCDTKQELEKQDEQTFVEPKFKVGDWVVQDNIGTYIKSFPWIKIQFEHHTVMFPCEFVHELQHALRLCGINKEIKLED